MASLAGFFAARLRVVALLLTAGLPPSAAVAQPRFDSIRITTNNQVALRLASTPGGRYQLETSPDLTAWSSLVTFAGATTFDHTDTTQPLATARYYRARALDDATALTGDHVATALGDVVVHPVNHASLLLQCQWNGFTIYIDPVGGGAGYAGLPRADAVLVTHSHGDHFDAATLAAIRKTNAPIVAPAAVYASLSATLKVWAMPLANGQSTNIAGLTLDAVPAYNANHPKGTGNGYVIGVGERRFYISGDTGDIPETRSLPNIDVAFLCMNTPFTMTVSQAASVVRAFAPRAVYPYHFRNQDGSFSDLNAFARQVGTDLGIEVRHRKWY